MPDRPATLRDVAAAARVHPATASRALNPETRILVSEDTARRVTDAAARLGYRPNPVARSLRTRRSHTIGVLIPDLNNPLFPPIVRGLEDKLGAAGYVALIGNNRRRRRPRAHPVRADAGPARRRVRAGHRHAARPAAGRRGRGGGAAGADEPAGAGLQLSLGLGRQRAGRADGGHPPGPARPHQDRARRRPAGGLHRHKPPARVPGRHGQPTAWRWTRT